MSKKWVLKEDFVIPAGTQFTGGPWERFYNGTNIEAIISISKDETGNFTLFVEPDTLELLEEISE